MVDYCNCVSGCNCHNAYAAGWDQATELISKALKEIGFTGVDEFIEMAHKSNE